MQVMKSFGEQDECDIHERHCLQTIPRHPEPSLGLDVPGRTRENCASSRLETPAQHFKRHSKKIDDDVHPPNYKLALRLVEKDTHEKEKVQHYELGKRRHDAPSTKRIILLGETGTGKSTLTDWMVNYVLGVTWEDDFKLKCVQLDVAEAQKADNQALSQTEWVTCYTIHHMEGSRVPYTLEIIDTPGFGDRDGVVKDIGIVKQLQTLFSTEIIKYIDAVCFIVKASDMRLSPKQDYIFKSIMSIFGKDMENNLCAIKTFDTGRRAPADAALNESRIPFSETFGFNNEATFSKVDHDECKISWDRGQENFKSFFKHIKKLEIKSLHLTKEVIERRSDYEGDMKALGQLLNVGLARAATFKVQLEVIESGNESAFTIEVPVRKDSIEKGYGNLNCYVCDMTCHRKCKSVKWIRNRYWCSRISRGYCDVCPQNCSYQKHAMTTYYISYTTQMKTVTVQELREEHKKNTNDKPTNENMVRKYTADLKQIKEDISAIAKKMKTTVERLSEIALEKNIMCPTDYYQMMITSEKQICREGWEKRVCLLEEMIKESSVPLEVEHFTVNTDTMLEEMKKVG